MNIKWTGHIRIYPEIHCDECAEIYHNHFDCPACNEKYAGLETYGEIEPDNGITEIQCESCHAKFRTFGKWHDSKAIWTRET